MMKRILEQILKGDRKAFHLLNEKIRCRLLDKSFPVITHLGGAVITCAFTIALILWGGPIFRNVGINIALSLFLSHMAVRVLKKKIQRKRPYDFLEEVNTHGLFWDDFSFPSGHTTAVFAICMTLALNVPGHLKILMLVALIIGISRIYIGVHYPIDVVVGALIGIVSAILVHRYGTPLWFAFLKWIVVLKI